MTKSGRSAYSCSSGSWKADSAEEPVLLAARASSGIWWIGQRVVRPDLRLGLEVRAARAVPALVDALVDVAVVVDLLQDLLDAPLVLGSVVRMKKSLRARRAAAPAPEALGVRSASSCGVRPRARAASATGSPCSSVPVRKNDVLAALAVVTGQDVGGDRRVRVAEVRGRVDVVDRGRDVVVVHRGSGRRLRGQRFVQRVGARAGELGDDGRRRARLGARVDERRGPRRSPSSSSPAPCGAPSTTSTTSPRAGVAA